VRYIISTNQNNYFCRIGKYRGETNMMTIIRHVFTSIFFGIILTVFILGLTFFVFPLDDWTKLLSQKLFNISYLFLVFIIVISISTIIGTITSLYWKQRIDYIERQLDGINNGQTLSNNEAYPEIKKIEDQLMSVQEKIRIQAEHAQRLATERANEREKSLQEIVIQERNRLARDLHDSV